MVQFNPSQSHHMLPPHYFTTFHLTDKTKTGDKSNDVTNLDMTRYDDLRSIESALSQIGAVLKATANAAGTTTTFITGNADVSDIAVGDILYLYNSVGTLLEVERRVTAIDLDTPTLTNATITFSPAAGAATAIDDTFKSVLYNYFLMNKMTVNDKIHALLLEFDPETVG